MNGVVNAEIASVNSASICVQFLLFGWELDLHQAGNAGQKISLSNQKYHAGFASVLS